jgi:hypothetical protein
MENYIITGKGILRTYLSNPYLVLDQLESDGLVRQFYLCFEGATRQNHNGQVLVPVQVDFSW